MKANAFLRKSPRRRGMSIVEVLISLAIVAMLLTAVAAAFSSSAQIIETNDQFFRASQAARVSLTRMMKREGRIWIRIFPDKPVTKKPAETRMGKGKGAPEYWVAVVKPGRVMFEVGGTNRETALEALRLASHKLPIKTKVSVRPDYEGHAS